MENYLIILLKKQGKNLNIANNYLLDCQNLLLANLCIN